MTNKQTIPNANIPQPGPNAPRGDRGGDDKTWTPPQGEQGISNRPDDDDEPSKEDRE